MKNSRSWIWIVVGIILIGGAAYFLQPGAEDKTSVVDSDSVAVSTEDVNQEAAEAESITQTPSSDVIVESKPTQENLPSPRSELEATDPSNVNLASGKVQLVEIFAFW